VSCSKPFSFIFAQFICRSKHYKSDRDIHHWYSLRVNF
jgi:hypothetical protein